jgi:hypothetical protein
MQETIANPQVGTTTVSVDQLLGNEKQINTLTTALSDCKATIAAKNEVISQLQKQLENNQLVITKKYDRWDNSTTYSAPLEGIIKDVKAEAKKEALNDLGEELIELRAFKKTYTDKVAEDKAVAEELDSLREQRHERELDSAIKDYKSDIVRLKGVNNDLRTDAENKIADLTKKHDRTIVELTALNQELTDRLNDKSEQQRLEKEIAAYKQTIDELTSLVRGNWFTRTLNTISGKTADKFNRINKVLADIAYNSINSNFKTVEVPKSFNKYATCEIYKEGREEEVDYKRAPIGRDFWGDTVYESIGTKVKQIWVKV